MEEESGKRPLAPNEGDGDDGAKKLRVEESAAAAAAAAEQRRRRDARIAWELVASRLNPNDTFAFAMTCKEFRKIHNEKRRGLKTNLDECLSVYFTNDWIKWAYDMVRVRGEKRLSGKVFFFYYLKLTRTATPFFLKLHTTTYQMLWEDCDDLVKTKLMRLAASLGKSAMLCRAETCHYCINGTMTDFSFPPPTC